jgi:hypothetical protein
MTEVDLAAVLPAPLNQYAGLFLKFSGLLQDIDPIFCAAVCWRESRGGEANDPPGPGGTGDSGHGRGLMQIDDRWHPDFCTAQVVVDGAPVYAWTIPEWNLWEGMRQLSTLSKIFGDNYRAIADAYNDGPARVLADLRAGRDPDSETTGKDYGTDVMNHVAKWHTQLDTNSGSASSTI